MLYLSTLLLSVFLTVSIIPMMTKLAERFHLVDFPNPRKVHTRAVPRIGGFAMALGAVFPIVLWTTVDNFVRAYLTGAAVLVVFGLLDDMRGLGYRAKFVGQLSAAAIVVSFGGVRIDSLGTLIPASLTIPEWLSAMVSLVAIVGVTNAINLSDGLDGLAGGISLLGFCAIGYLAYIAGDPSVLVLSLALAGAIFGFLRYNTYPATLFMGDTGSQLLGFSAIVFSIRITQGCTPLSPVLPLLILGFPVLDTLTVMAERVRTGRSPFSADTNHFHHRLVRFGLHHTEAVFIIYLIQSTMILAAILFKYHSDWMLVTAYALFACVVIGSFAVADRTGFTFTRSVLIDASVKGRLKKIRDQNWVIRLSFSFSKVAVPSMLVWSTLQTARVPGYVAVIAVFFIASLLVVRLFAGKHLGICLRFVLFLTIPLLLYLVEQGRAAWMGPHLVSMYHVSFAVIALMVLLVVKYSRRATGFKATPMDFLILFIAVVVPNLPDHSIKSFQLGSLAVEIVVLLFSCEVLIKELRERLDGLLSVTLVVLIALGVRGLLPS